MPRPLLTRPSVVLFLCLFTSQAGLLVLSPVLPDIAREYGISTATAGQLRSLTGAAGGLTALLLAVAPRRPGLRDLLSAGAGLVALGAALTAAAPAFWALAAAQTVLGVGLGLLVAAGIAAAGTWPAPAERPHVLAWTIAGMPCAWVLGMPVVGALAEVDWRAAWLAVPALVGLLTFALLRLRPADPATSGSGDAVTAWRRPDVARFAGGELLANAAWASVLTYAGALLLDSYAISAAAVGVGLAVSAAGMVPGTFLARSRAGRPTRALLMSLTTFQAGAVLVLGLARPTPVLSLAVIGVMCFVNGWRSMIASAFGMDTAPDDKVAVMAMRASANQFGYLLGAAVGGAAIAVAGFAGLGVALAALFVAGTLVHGSAQLRQAGSRTSLWRSIRPSATTAAP